MRNLLLFALSLFSLFIIWSFNKQPQPGNTQPSNFNTELISYLENYFIPPVAGPIHLTGTCGELRPDHFHAGADIDGKVGNPVYATADGFVDRIKVLESGYGNVLYIKHPNGYTTVYAHLDRFSSDIQQYVKENQYRNERFTVELQPTDGKFKVKKGQEIAKLGNSGSSSGPHLHYEIRTPNGKTVNPMLYGLPVTDNIDPDLRDMKVYFLTENREVLGSKAFPLYKDKKGTIGIENDTIGIGGWRIGFGVKTYDRSTGFRNDNGVYSISLWADEQLAYEWKADAFDFDETRYMNAHIDYAAKARYGAWFHRCFLLPGNKLSNYTATPTLGAIQLYKDRPVKIRLKISDASGNAQTLAFWVKRDENNMENFVSQPYQFEVPYDADSHFDFEGVSMSFAKGSFYEKVPFQYSTSPDESSGVFSSVHHLHDTRTPVHKYFDLSIRPINLPVELRNKAVIANCSDGKPANCGSSWQGDMLKTRVRNLGDYCVMIDTVPPSISAVVFSADMRKKPTLAFRISDNFAISGTADGMRYRGTIDGKWVLFEYDKKRSRLNYDFDEHVGAGEHKLQLNVVDDKGNQKTFVGNFIR
jgi:hypothetical protein